MRMEREKLGYLFLGMILLIFLAGGTLLWIFGNQGFQIKSGTKAPEKIHEEIKSVPNATHSKQVNLKFQFALEEGRKPTGLTERKDIAFTDWKKTEDFIIPDRKPVQGSICQKMEYRGEGYAGTRIASEDWKKIIDVFHHSKRLLMGWVEHSPSLFQPKTAQWMQAQLSHLRIYKPPYLEEPDLAWRGIGVVSRDEKGLNFVRLGSGFIRMAFRDPVRSLFEMTRLVAQVWIPSEFEKVRLEMPWAPLLSCLHLSEDDAASEKGWAVASTLAFFLSSPGCELPIFHKNEPEEGKKAESTKSEAALCVEKSLNFSKNEKESP